MIEARHGRGNRSASGGMFSPASEMLDSVLHDEEAQPIIARLLSACYQDSAIDVETHVLRIAAIALRAKRRPFNKYAEATL